MESTLKRTWAEIHLDNLAYNYHAIQKQVGEKTKLLGVVKADAYGHGAVRIARVLETLGASYLAVSSIDEAEELRANGIKLPILMLGFSPEDQGERIVRLQVTQAVQNYEIAYAFNEAAGKCHQKMKVHIKLDTGMGRLGFLCDEENFNKSVETIKKIIELPNLDVEGVFTHFSVSDELDADSVSYTENQHERFVRMIRAIEDDGNFKFKLHHCCNAGAICYHPEWAWDMVRCGIILYGTGDQAQQMGLKPVMTLKTVVSTIRQHRAGDSIGYGRTFRVKHSSRIAVIPIGYADGLFRSLSNRFSVLTPYGNALIAGRICMDMCMIDVTDQPELQVGDEVEVYGEKNLCNTAAKTAGTITYELLCAVSKRVPRLYIQNRQIIDSNLQLLA